MIKLQYFLSIRRPLGQLLLTVALVLGVAAVVQPRPLSAKYLHIASKADAAPWHGDRQDANGETSGNTASDPYLVNGSLGLTNPSNPYRTQFAYGGGTARGGAGSGGAPSFQSPATGVGNSGGFDSSGLATSGREPVRLASLGGGMGSSSFGAIGGTPGSGNTDSNNALRSEALDNTKSNTVSSDQSATNGDTLASNEADGDTDTTGQATSDPQESNGTDQTGSKPTNTTVAQETGDDGKAGEPIVTKENGGIDKPVDTQETGGSGGNDPIDTGDIAQDGLPDLGGEIPDSGNQSFPDEIITAAAGVTVPEPGNLLLFGAALVLLGFASGRKGRRRNRHTA